MLVLLAAAVLSPLGPFDSVTSQMSQADLKKLFTGNAKISFSGDAMIVESNGIPDHPTGTFPNASNPNSIRVQQLKFYIPLKPTKSEVPSRTPFGPIGVATNGVAFYNQYNAEGGDAVRLEVFDSCCGHPDQRGLYHYHQYPSCLKSPFHDPAGKHSPLIGFMFDGYAIYGPNGEDGQPPKNLDACNGHWDATRGYHYHCTKGFPYLVGSYRGVVDQRNMMRGGPGGPYVPGGPGRPPFPPPPPPPGRGGGGNVSK